MNDVLIDKTYYKKSSNTIVKNLVMLKKALIFCYNFYELKTDQHITLSFRDIGNSYGQFGWVNSYSNNLQISISPFYTKYLDGGELRQILFHEFTHFIQYLEGRLSLTNLPPYYDKNGFNIKLYKECPFEIEAREMEKILEYSFNKYWNNYKNKVNVNIEVK
ncbi:SprT-like domain-containing protein [Ochrobactrum phage vB_OspM_OC]|nr:SprT-like domain-containing protein [Ochrobactrum phage vB_OspM_OC]